MGPVIWRLGCGYSTGQNLRAWQVRSPNLAPLFDQAMSKVRDLRARGCRVSFAQLPRANNAEADTLANRAMDERNSGSILGDDFQGIISGLNLRNSSRRKFSGRPLGRPDTA